MRDPNDFFPSGLFVTPQKIYGAPGTAVGAMSGTVGTGGAGGALGGDPVLQSFKPRCAAELLASIFNACSKYGMACEHWDVPA